MDHPCEKCGSPVEDGRPFCPHCRAPQVRVLIGAETSEPIGAIARSVPPPPRPVIESGNVAGALDRRIAVQAALKAGILGILIGIIPFLGIALTGALAVFFYRRGTRVPLNPGLGSRVGGAAGAISFLISAAFTIIQVFVLHAYKESEEGLLKLLTVIGADPTDARIQTMVHELFTPSGLAISLPFALILTVAMAAIGGAIAAAILKPR